MVNVRCPECGETFSINEERGFGFCIACGAKIVIGKSAESAGTSINDEARKILVLSDAARQSLAANDFATAAKAYQEAYLLDPSNWEFFSSKHFVNRIIAPTENCRPRPFLYAIH